MGHDSAHGILHAVDGVCELTDVEILVESDLGADEELLRTEVLAGVPQLG